MSKGSKSSPKKGQAGTGGRRETGQEDETGTQHTDEEVVDRLPSVGEVVSTAKHRLYQLVEVIGEGGFGSVFRVFCDNSETSLAFKAEKYSKTALTVEVAVLKSANARKCKHICELFDYGRVERLYAFIVITLLGPDLYKMRRRSSDQRYSLGTTVMAGIQTLQAVQELHTCGYLSRDIKPSNFAIGRKQEETQRIIYIFDFGLAKKFVDSRFSVLPSRGSVGWRGTARYGSLNSHLKKDLGRRDDLESWFYMLVEFANGSLPWRFEENRMEVRLLKERSRREMRDLFLTECPPQFSTILTEIDGLRFESRPCYEHFIALLEEVLADNDISSDSPFDWEEEETSSVHERSTQTLPPTHP